MARHTCARRFRGMCCRTNGSIRRLPKRRRSVQRLRSPPMDAATRPNIGNYSEIGSQGVFSYSTQDVWSLQPNASLIHGKHVLKFGSELRRYNDNNLNPGLASGLYNFSAAWTQANPQRGDSASGNEFASFLLGYPS